jgi:hypothetical protein
MMIEDKVYVLSSVQRRRQKYAEDKCMQCRLHRHVLIPLTNAIRYKKPFSVLIQLKVL